MLEKLQNSEWQALASAHQAEMARWTNPFRERRRVGDSHPVHDFLFVYYQYSPAKLEQWHPGVGVMLETANNPDLGPEYFSNVEYSATETHLFCDPEKIPPKTLNRLKWIVNLLKSTEARRPNFSCLGLHEWAMVYQGKEVRHEKTTKLRLPQSEIDELVESRPLTCTHFDAFRFFADSARPLNKIQPTLDDRPQLEQPACIHANMDLYKWAFKAMPWVGSDLLARCFHLAMKARAIDMRASPYDLSDYGDYDPILIETAEGRASYEQHQREITEAAKPLRKELADRIEFVLTAAETNTHSLNQ